MTNGDSARPAGAAWDRTGPGPLLRPTGRKRAAIFLGVNLLGYALANMFLNYLATGRWINWPLAVAAESFSRPISFMLIQPLNIFTHPWLVLVFALLLAAVVIVPLLVACLYHSRAVAAFLVCVPLLAGAPRLTLAIAAGAAVVAASGLRKKAPFLSVMLGLLPVGAYLYFASSFWPFLMADMEMLLLYTPFVLALLAAVAMAATVLVIAKLIGYRPGAVWPAMAVLLAAPAWIFFDRIGRDELQFALIHQQLTRPDGLLEDQPLSHWLSRAAGADPGAQALARALAGRPDEPPSAGQVDRAQELIHRRLEQRKQEVIARCDRFLQHWPESPRRPAVMWVRGITIDTQLSVRALQNGQVRFTDRTPALGADASRRSADNWRRLAEAYPEDPRAAIARCRLALLTVRPGPLEAHAPATRDNDRLLQRVRDARLLLREAQALLAGHSRPPAAPAGGENLAEMLSREMTLPSEHTYYETFRRVRELLWLIEVNRAAADAANAEALMHLLRLDDERYTHAEYVRRVRQLRRRYQDTALRDNFALAEAMTYTDMVYRTRALLAMEDVPGADASIAANYELGKIALQDRAWPSLQDEGLQSPEYYFRRVAEVAMDNPWKFEAAEQLNRRLIAAGAAATTQGDPP